MCIRKTKGQIEKDGEKKEKQKDQLTVSSLRSYIKGVFKGSGCYEM